MASLTSAESVAVLAAHRAVMSRQDLYGAATYGPRGPVLTLIIGLCNITIVPDQWDEVTERLAALITWYVRKDPERSARLVCHKTLLLVQKP